MAWDDVTDKPTTFPPSEHDTDHDDRFSQLGHTHPAAGSVPVGTVVMWPTATPPTDWLICDGSAIPGAYTALIALVGANTPNLMGKFPIGAKTGTTPALGATGGSFDHTHNTPGHSHSGVTGTVGGHKHTVDGAAINPPTGTGNRLYVHNATTGERHWHDHTNEGSHSHTISSSGGLTSDPANPPYLGIMFIIKAA